MQGIEDAMSQKNEERRQGCSQGPRNGAQQNSTWPTPLAGRGQALLLLNTRAFLPRVAVSWEAGLEARASSTCRAAHDPAARQTLVVSCAFEGNSAVRQRAGPRNESTRAAIAKPGSALRFSGIAGAALAPTEARATASPEDQDESEQVLHHWHRGYLGRCVEWHFDLHNPL
jgi:hypothetical protein